MFDRDDYKQIVSVLGETSDDIRHMSLGHCRAM